jgi:hypothetical protein
MKNQGFPKFVPVGVSDLAATPTLTQQLQGSSCFQRRAVLRPIVRRTEADPAHPISIEGQRQLAPVKAVVALDGVAVPLDNVEAVSH